MTSENEQWLRRQEAVEGSLRHRDDERRKSQKVNRRNRQTPCCHKGEFEAAVYICFGFIGVAALVLVIPFAMIFLHSNEDLVKRFVYGSCTVLRYNDTGTTFSCKCTQGRWCISSYPCFILYATLEYTEPDGSRKKIVTQLYEDMYGVTNEYRCSVDKCNKDELSNKRAVDSFMRSWTKIGKYSDCYYDTRNPHRSSMRKPVVIPIRWDFLPFVVVIGMVAVFCLFIVFCVCCLYGCTDCCIWVKENNKFCPTPHYGS